MIPDRRTLKTWAKWAVVAAYVLYGIAAILERADRTARRAAESEVLRHEWNEHDEVNR